MLNFSTEIPIDPKNSVADVLRLASEWITGSPHTVILKGALDAVEMDVENNFEFENERVTVIHSAVDDGEIGGLKYVKKESNGLEWTSMMVCRRRRDTHVIGFQVNCEALNTAVRLPPPAVVTT
jgi:hypothetical protein